MDVLTAFAPSIVAAVAVFLVAYLGKERYDPQFAALRGDVRELKEDMRQLRGEMATIRSDLTHVALVVGARSKPDAS